MAEYIAAHELGHAIQFARGYPILVGNAYRPATTTIAKRISNFLLDSSADAIAVQYGFPMAPSFERYLELKEVRGIVNNLKNGGSQGDNWARIWEYIEETIISEALQNKLSRIPRDLNTLLVASTFANIVQRASNLGLTIGYQVLNDIKRFPLLSRVIDDLLNIGTPSGICSIGELLSKLKRVFDYLKPKPGQLSIYKPLTDQILH
jgi:hypothetical protein